MKTEIDAQLLREARRFAWRFACDDCVHFDSDHDQCSLGFDATLRRGSMPEAYELEDSRHKGRTLELCKTFELA